MGKICKICGKQINPGVKFCPFCGTLTKTQPAAMAEKRPTAPDPLSKAKPTAGTLEFIKENIGRTLVPLVNLFVNKKLFTDKKKDAAINSVPGADQKSVTKKEPVAIKDRRFAALEEEYNRLNLLAQAGCLTLEQFREKVDQLIFQDTKGTWWQLHFNGRWLKWNGKTWVESEPDS